MARRFLYRIHTRDFTLCKAAALVILIGLAIALGGVPHQARDMAGNVTVSERHVPAMLLGEDALCDVAEEVGIEL